MAILFQADSDINQRIVSGLVRLEPAIDIWTPHRGGLIDQPDPEVLRLAAASGRILISHDESTMPRHFFEFLADQTSPGVLIIPQDVPIGVAIEELLMIWATSEAHEWKNRLDFIPI